MRKHGALLLLAGVALISAAALGQGSRASLTDQSTITANTFTSDPCGVGGDTGFLDPTAQVADTGGDGNGFEDNPTYAFGNGSLAAGNWNGAGDRHRYYDYGIAIPAGCSFAGIEVRVDWWLSSTFGSNSLSIELSWDGGTSWTAAQTDTVETTSEHTTTLGSAADTWGHAWAVSELSNANFRVRVTSNSSSSFRDFFLEWIPVRVYYGP